MMTTQQYQNNTTHTTSTLRDNNDEAYSIDEISLDVCSTDDGFSLEDSQDNLMQINRSSQHPIASTSKSKSSPYDSKDNNDKSLRQNQGGKTLSEKETKNVRRLKLSVITILTVSAIVTGVLSYWYLRRTETTKFQEMFEDDANKLGSAVHGNVITVLSALDMFSTVMVATARLSQNKFPTTTIPYFGNIASKFLSLSIAVNIWTTMLVNGTQQRLQWEEYAWNQRSFVNDTLNVMTTDPTYYGTIPWNISMNQSIHDDYSTIPYNESRLFAPLWQTYPMSSDDFTAFNWDWITDEDPDPFIQCFNTSRAIIGEPYILPDPSIPTEVDDAAFWADVFSGVVNPGDNPLEPVSDILYPVIDRIDKVRIIDESDPTATEENEAISVLSATFYWRDALKNILPDNKRGLVVVVHNPCTASFTYLINGQQATFQGRGDLHDTKYEHMGIQKNFFDLVSQTSVIQSQYTGVPVSTDYCTFSICMYPSKEMEQQFTSYNPIIFASVGVLIFVFTSIVFLLYDTQVEQRQKMVMTTAVRSTAVLSSLFPSAIRDKILQQENALSGNSSVESPKELLVKPKKQPPIPTPVGKSKHPMGLGMTIEIEDKPNPSSHFEQKERSGINEINVDSNGTCANLSSMIKQKFASPIADLYPNTTVFFGDICGFTAWSSSRGPDHVFILLESLYSEFDKIARRRKVFKVETIGDSYVAVAGLPEPMSHHVTIMCKFAEDILQKMKIVVNELSTYFGPDTADLSLRIGLNSGPTTAGVIRGEKSRFQLFGDTVNTAARMESTGVPGRIQCSPKTAELIRRSGKGHWLRKRNDVVQVKGKGEMTTYWIHVQTRSSSRKSPTSIDQTSPSFSEDNDSSATDLAGPIDSSIYNVGCSRLVEWNSGVFQSLLLDLLVFRQSQQQSPLHCPQDDETNELPTDHNSAGSVGQPSLCRRLPLDEVVEVLNLPETTWNRQLSQQISLNAILDEPVIRQLTDFLTMIASMYQNSNPFHNFEHASHVVMSTKNLLDRIDIPSAVTRKLSTVADRKSSASTSQLNLDPLVRLAIVFGALVHDVDHLGIPNSQLTKEQTSAAKWYKDRCVAEQNSFDVAWNTFMLPQYNELRHFIFQNNTNDYNRFRQVMLNVVMATDIFDNDLKALRQSRWDKVFTPAIEQQQLPTQISNHDKISHRQHVDSIDEHNRKATICIEHLIQASDVIHTMQHWTVYQKWNRNLFIEMNIAYQNGRLEKNPCLSWYDGELWFFDNYIIPLAKKLKVCGVFGANSAAFLDYASDNRVEWESKGKAIVTEWIEEMNLHVESLTI